MKQYFRYLPMILVLSSCTPTVEKISVENAEYVLNNCQITYKGKDLPLGKKAFLWDELFGKHRGGGGWLWDEYSIGLQTFVDPNYHDDELYIFFTNLDSKLGLEGKLQFALNYHIVDEKSLMSKKKKYPKWIPFTQEEVNKLKEQYHKKNYFYPYKIYDKVVNVDGCAIKAGMTLKQINEQRALAGLDRFGYWDRDMDFINESYSTKVKTGEFYTTLDIVEDCGRNDKYYHVTLRFTEGVLEYIKVKYHENKADYIFDD